MVDLVRETAKENQQIKMYTIPEETLNKALAYLGGCPWQEVSSVMAALYGTAKPIPPKVVKSPEERVKELERELEEEKAKIQTPKKILAALKLEVKELEDELAKAR